MGRMDDAKITNPIVIDNVCSRSASCSSSIVSAALNAAGVRGAGVRVHQGGVCGGGAAGVPSPQCGGGGRSGRRALPPMRRGWEERPVCPIGVGEGVGDSAGM